MKKKFLSMAFAAVMLLSVFAAGAYADEDISSLYGDDDYDEEPADYDDYEDDMYLYEEEDGYYPEYYYDESEENTEETYGGGKNYLEDIKKYEKESGGKKEDDGAIKVYYQDEEIEFDVAPVIVEGRTLVPMRAIFEKLGADIGWNGETRTVTAVKYDVTVSIAIGSNCLYVNGKEVELDVPAQIFGDRTFLPLRAISEAFGAKVDWYGDTKTVTINQA